jgi:DNA-binding transcriptional MerR regulator
MWVMAGDRLMSIGGFAQQSGLSVPALRYYDEIELLAPASVDPSSGYRRYHPSQLAVARQIYILWALELPFEAVREVVSGGAGLAAAVRAHRERLVDRVRVLDDVAAAVNNDDDDSVTRFLLEFVETGDFSCRSRPPAGSFRSRSTPTAFRGKLSFTARCSGVNITKRRRRFVFGTWKADSFFPAVH